MPIRKRTLDLAVNYIDQHFGKRYIFPIEPGKKFPPKVKDNLDTNASNDPVQLAAWEAKWPGCNWGVAHRKSGIMVADVDTNVNKNKVGQATFDDLDLFYGWPATETTTTPSGGMHLIYEGWADDNHPAHIMALGENGIGKDIDSPNYTLIPGCTFDDGTSYVGNGAEAVRCPEWIYDVIKTAKTKSRITDAGEVVIDLDQQANIDLAIDFLREDAEPSISGAGGDFNLLKAANYLKDIGISQQLGAELLNEYFNPRCEPPWDMADLEKKMLNAYNYANLSKVGGKTAEADFADMEPEEPVEPMGIFDIPSQTYKKDRKKVSQEAKARADARKREAGKPDDPSRAKTKSQVLDQFAYVVDMDRFVSIDPPVGRPRIEWKARQFDNEFNRVFGKKTGSISDELLRKKKGGITTYPHAAFKPGQPREVDGALNMYRTPDIEPVEGDITWWNEHLAYLFPNETYRNHFLNWSAWLLQNLAEKPKHALIIQGEVNGTGKSFLGKVLSRLLHEANVSTVSQTSLSKNFNAWALASKLILIEELRAADKRAVKETLHDLITEDRIAIEKKGIDIFSIDTCFGVLAFTNDEAALDLDNTDRRYLVIRTDRTEAEAREKSNAGYFARLFGRLRDPVAMGAVLYSLVNRDLGVYSGQQPAPMTQAKAGMKVAAMNDLEHHLEENRETWPLNSRVLCIDDVINVLPKRLETKGFRLHTTIKKFLMTQMAGFDLGQCTTPSGVRPRLYAINGAAAILEGQPRNVAGKLYEDDKAREAKKQPLEPLEVDAATEFGDSDDVQ